MWDHDGYSAHDRRKIVNGPSLERILISHDAFQVGMSVPLEFHPDGPANHPFRHIYPINHCVASIEYVSAERVNLKLDDRPGGCGYSYYVVYGYNHRKHRGNIEQFKKWEGEEPLGYEPVRIPHVDEMMKLDDNEFIMVYAINMLTYKRSENYKFPIRCGRRGCQKVIRHHLDMRKLGGQCLCPECFVEEVTTDNGVTDYLRRAARLLPRHPLAVPLWPEGVMPDNDA